MLPLEVIALSPCAHELMAPYGRRPSARRFRDRRGRTIDIGEWQPRDWHGLLAMYSSFDPTQRLQGLPPLTETRQAVWVEKLLGRGPNVVARAGGRVVGHAAVVTYDGGVSHQLVLFVHQDYQAAGIDEELADEMLRLVRRQSAQETSILASVGTRLRDLVVHARETVLGRLARRGAPRVAHLVADLDEIEVIASRPPKRGSVRSAHLAEMP